MTLIVTVKNIGRHTESINGEQVAAGETIEVDLDDADVRRELRQDADWSVVGPPSENDIDFVRRHSTVEDQSTPMWAVTGSTSAVDGTVYFSKVTATKDYVDDDAITKVYALVATAGNYTADNENRIGIYTFDGTQFVLEAATPNDGNLWKTAGLVSATLATPFECEKGDDFWVAPIFNWSAVVAAPLMARSGMHFSVPRALVGAGVAAMGGLYGGLSDPGVLALPATQSAALDAGMNTIGPLWAGVS